MYITNTNISFILKSKVYRKLKFDLNYYEYFFQSRRKTRRGHDMDISSVDDFYRKHVELKEQKNI